MGVFSCPLEITPAEWIASSLLLLPPETPVSIQGIMSHLFCMRHPLSETFTSSSSISILFVLPPNCCPVCAPALSCLESTFLACWTSVLSLPSVPLLTVIDDFLAPLSSPSWGHTQPNLCRAALICSAGVSVCLFSLWFAFQPHKLPISWMRDCSHMAVSLLYFRCIVLFSGMSQQLKASSPTVTSPLEFSLGLRLSCPLALRSYKIRGSFKPPPFLGDWLARAAHRMHECIFPIITSSIRRKELQGEANEEILSVGDGAGDTEPPCPLQAGCPPSTAVHPALSEACC